jgi:hypothetical protein
MPQDVLLTLGHQEVLQIGSVAGEGLLNKDLAQLLRLLVRLLVTQPRLAQLHEDYNHRHKRNKKKPEKQLIEVKAA